VSFDSNSVLDLGLRGTRASEGAASWALC